MGIHSEAVECKFDRMGLARKHCSLLTQLLNQQTFALKGVWQEPGRPRISISRTAYRSFREIGMP